eukprot:2419046-Lingulodinium_polyedra.AAC.1
MGDTFEETGASPKSANDYFKHNRKALHREPTHPSEPKVKITPYDDGIDRLPLQLLAAPVE